MPYVCPEPPPQALSRRSPGRRSLDGWAQVGLPEAARPLPLAIVRAPVSTVLPRAGRAPRSPTGIGARSGRWFLERLAALDLRMYVSGHLYMSDTMSLAPGFRLLDPRLPGVTIFISGSRHFQLILPVPPGARRLSTSSFTAPGERQAKKKRRASAPTRDTATRLSTSDKYDAPRAIKSADSDRRAPPQTD